jgi:membrane-associated phospholipid phosphatase
VRSLALGAVLLAVFVLLALTIPAGPLEVEQRWSAWMADIRCPFLDHLALVFNTVGRGFGRALMTVAPAVVLIVWRRWVGLLAYGVAEAGSALASSVSKAFVDRPRPVGSALHPHGASFPSGHVTFAGVTSAALVLLFTTPGASRKVWWALALVVTAGMAWSRTYLQVHWLLDVVGGAMLGISCALVVFGAVEVTRRERATPPRPAPAGAGSAPRSAGAS